MTAKSSDSRECLRHTLATLVYRAARVLRDAPWPLARLKE